MTRKLNQSDRQAVDLVLDQMAKGQDGDGVIAVGAPPTEPRVEALGKILSVLENMPAAEPPADLVKRTLQLIERGTPQPAQTRPVPPYLGPGQLPA